MRRKMRSRGFLRCSAYGRFSTHRMTLQKCIKRKAVVEQNYVQEKGVSRSRRRSRGYQTAMHRLPGARGCVPGARNRVGGTGSRTGSSMSEMAIEHVELSFGLVTQPAAKLVS